MSKKHYKDEDVKRQSAEDIETAEERSTENYSGNSGSRKFLVKSRLLLKMLPERVRRKKLLPERKRMRSLYS